MNQTLLETANIYQSICVASNTGRKRGLSVRELKKKYNMKNRDIMSLISFLNTYDMVGDALCVYYNVYRLTSSYTSDKDNLSYDALDEEDVEELDLEQEDPDNDTYIRIQDSVMILRERIREEDIDITNASFLHTIQNEMNELWDKISDVKLDADYVVMRDAKTPLRSDLQDRKLDWVQAVIKGNVVSVRYRSQAAAIRREDVLPLGMYYNSFLDQYLCVYQDEKGEKHRITLNEIEWLERHEDEYRSGIHFNIYDYIKSIQKEKMILHVYKEGNVPKKIKKLLADNRLTVDEGEIYDVFTFWTEDVWQYMKVLKSYGRSVVVVEPAYIREEMVRSTKEALAFYQGTATMFTEEAEYEDIKG